MAVQKKNKIFKNKSRSILRSALCPIVTPRQEEIHNGFRRLRRLWDFSKLIFKIILDWRKNTTPDVIAFQKLSIFKLRESFYLKKVHWIIASKYQRFIESHELMKWYSNGPVILCWTGEINYLASSTNTKLIYCAYREINLY